MTPQELQKLREDLLQEIQIIEAELGRFTVKNPVVRDDYQSVFPKTENSDTLDEKARSVTDYENERAIEQSLEMRLKEIKDTLAKLENNSYGVCEKCLSNIDEKRLKAVSTVHLCFGCAKIARLVYAPKSPAWYNRLRS